MATLQENIEALRAEGKTYSAIARELQCSKSTVCYWIGAGQREKTKARRDKSKPHPLQRKLWDFCRVNGGIVEDEKITLQDVLDKVGENPRCYLTGNLIDITKTETYSLDHRVPRSQGGKNTLENLEIATKDANQSKHAMQLEDYIELCRKVVEKHVQEKEV